MRFLAVYGHVNVDYILQLKNLPGPETTLPVERTLVRLGGTGGNIARAATALGVPTSIAACVGDDFPPAYRTTLEASGLDLSDLRHVPGSTPKVWILSVPGGPQSTVIDQGVMGDGQTRPPLDLAWLSAEWVHLTTGDPQEWRRVAAEAKKAKKHIAFDPAQELSYRYAGRMFEQLLNDSDVFFCNEHELGRGLDHLGYGDAHQLFDHTKRLVITRGSQGTRLMTPKETLEVPACPLRGGPPESTGAGDAFRGGLYAALHRRQEWPEAVRVASVAASLFLEANGDRFATWDEVVRRLDEWKP